MIPFLDLKAQYRSIKDEVDRAIEDVITNTQFILGPAVEAFERDFAKYCGADYAIGVNSGTSALHLAMLAIGVGEGDEVITVSHTFVATAAAIRYCNAQPVFVDVTPGTFTMDPAKIEAAITSRTKAIMPVHLYGQCADMDPIMAIARKHKLAVIEDAAQAHGAKYRGKPAGSIGDFAIFSFYPGKNLGAYGEGGAVVTSDRALVDKMRMLRDHGQSRKYAHDVLGYNYRLEGIQGAVLGVKLRHLDDWNRARREHAKRYRELLKMEMLEEASYGEPVYHIFPVFSAKRDALQAHLTANGVATGIHYPIPVHLQKAFEGTGGNFPVTERAANETLSLPMFAELTDEQIETVAKAVNDFAS